MVISDEELIEAFEASMQVQPWSTHWYQVQRLREGLVSAEAARDGAAGGMPWEK